MKVEQRYTSTFKTHILHDMLSHPQPFFLHLHHIIFLIFWVIDLFQLEEANEQMLESAEMLCLTLLSR